MSFAQTKYSDILKSSVSKNGKTPDVGYITDDYRVFSGTDITAYVSIPGICNYKLGTLALLSISTHRDKFPVSTLGRVNPKGFTFGHRTCGGTMVFATLDKSVWYSIMRLVQDNRSAKFPNDLYRGHPDDLPPFDINITFLNEYGHASFTGLIGVTILDEGETYSVEEPEVRETYSYMALERIPMQLIDTAVKAPAAAPSTVTASPVGIARTSLENSCLLSWSISTLNFPASGSTLTSVANVSSGPSDIVPSDNWIHTDVNTANDGNTTVSVTTDPNTTTSTRSGSVTTCGNILSINQLGIVQDPCSTSLDPNSIVATSDGGTFDVLVTPVNDTPMTLSQDGSSSWAVLTPSIGTIITSSDVIHVSIAANNTGSPRTGTVFLCDASISLYQDPLICNVTFSMTAVTISHNAQTVSIDLTGSGWVSRPILLNPGSLGLFVQQYPTLLVPTLVVSVPINSTNHDRVWTVQICSEVLTITQEPQCFGETYTSETQFLSGGNTSSTRHIFISDPSSVPFSQGTWSSPAIACTSFTYITPNNNSVTFTPSSPNLFLTSDQLAEFNAFRASGGTSWAITYSQVGASGPSNAAIGIDTAC